MDKPLLLATEDPVCAFCTGADKPFLLESSSLAFVAFSLDVYDFALSLLAFEALFLKLS